MPMSEYVAGMRELIGHRMMLLPAVSAIAVDGDGRVLLGLHADTGRWSTIGGAIDPDESPLDAVAREVPEIRYVGWDFAVTPTGAAVIEGNYNTGVFQLKPSVTGVREGLLPLYRSVIGF